MKWKGRRFLLGLAFRSICKISSSLVLVTDLIQGTTSSSTLVGVVIKRTKSVANSALIFGCPSKRCKTDGMCGNTKVANSKADIRTSNVPRGQCQLKMTGPGSSSYVATAV